MEPKVNYKQVEYQPKIRKPKRKNKVAKPDQLVEEPNTKPNQKVEVQNKEILTDESVTPLHDVGNGYVEFNNGLYKADALRELRPDLFSAKASLVEQPNTNFGTTFPKIAKKGDMFVRVDVLPNRVFKFDGKKWLEQNKDVSQSYLGNKDYIEFLVEKIGSGEYDLDVLSDTEKSEIEDYLKGNQNS